MGLEKTWTARRPNKSILKKISAKYSLKGLILKLKLQYFGHLMQRIDSLEKTLMLGNIEGRKRGGQQRMRLVGGHHWLDGHEFEQALGVGDEQGSLVGVLQSWGHKESDMTEWLTWTELGLLGKTFDHKHKGLYLELWFCLLPFYLYILMILFKIAFFFILWLFLLKNTWFT